MDDPGRFVSRRMMSRKRPSRPHSADIELLASVRADELRFDESPETEVRFLGEPGYESASGSDRTNLPETGRARRDLPKRAHRLPGRQPPCHAAPKQVAGRHSAPLTWPARSPGLCGAFPSAGSSAPRALSTATTLGRQPCERDSRTTNSQSAVVPQGLQAAL